MLTSTSLATFATLSLATLSLSAPLTVKRQDTTNQNNILVSPAPGFTATSGQPFDFSYEYFSNTNPNYNSSNCRSIDVELWTGSPYHDGAYANELLPLELAIDVPPVDGWFNLTFTLPELWTPNTDNSFQLVVIEHRYEGWSSGLEDVTAPFTMQNQTIYLNGASHAKRSLGVVEDEKLEKRQDTTNQNNLLISPADGFKVNVGEPWQFSYEYFSNTNPNYNSSNCRSIDVELWRTSPYVDGTYPNLVLPWELAKNVKPIDGWFNLTFTLDDLYTPNPDGEFQLVVIEHRYEGYSSGFADVTSPFTMQNQTFFLNGASN